MQIEQARAGERLTLTIEGRIDTTTAPGLESVIGGLDDGVKELVLDMTGVEYISSAGLRVLLAAQKRMSKTGRMRLTGVCAAVREVFEMTGFVDILEIE